VELDFVETPNQIRFGLLSRDSFPPSPFASSPHFRNFLAYYYFEQAVFLYTCENPRRFR
ncbi:hypothetical protein ACHAXS_013559, partial [Conticribra weissflogii]